MTIQPRFCFKAHRQQGLVEKRLRPLAFEVKISYIVSIGVCDAHAPRSGLAAERLDL
jgi:hypothetical protein